ncbi:MAG: protein phosphatase 2C domain-containing protein [Chloroflexota bacterium]
MVRDPTPHLAWAARSHAGETGKNNEDRWSVLGYHLETDNTPLTLAVVTDGIGGHQAGEVAAEVALDTFVRSLATYREGDPIAALQAAVANASRAVSEASFEAPEREGMGSTLSAAWVIGQRLYTVSVGDSRIYRLRGGRLQQLTIDHTWVQEAIEHKIIPPSMAHRHPNAHVLRRHLGSKEEVEPDFRLRLSSQETDEQSRANQGLTLLPDDRLLLCTDGLTDLVHDGEIRSALRHTNLERAAEHLISLARRRGGFDNITVVVLAVPGLPAVRRRHWLRWTLAILILLGLGLAAWLLIPRLAL